MEALAQFDTIFAIWVPFTVAVVALALNIIQFIGYRHLHAKLHLWTKDADDMASAIVELQGNIKKKKISKLSAIKPTLETLNHFTTGMRTAMEEELGYPVHGSTPLVQPSIVVNRKVTKTTKKK